MYCMINVIAKRLSCCISNTQQRNDVIKMTTINDAFNNEYIVVRSNDTIETITRIVHHYVIREMKFVSTHEYLYRDSFARATQNVAMNIIYMIRENECERFYVDDIHDFVYTYFHYNDNE